MPQPYPNVEKAGAEFMSNLAVAVPVVTLPVDSLASCCITNEFVPVTDLTSKLLSKLLALKLVPDQLVVPEKVTTSPTRAPCPLTLTVTLADPFVVVNILVTELFVCLIGVMSYKTSLANM